MYTRKSSVLISMVPRSQPTIPVLAKRVSLVRASETAVDPWSAKWILPGSWLE